MSSTNSSCTAANCTSPALNSTTTTSSAVQSTTSASAFFSANLQFFIYGFVVAGIVALLILLVLIRMRYDAQLRKRYAYESEFDVRKEMLRKQKKRAKEKQRAALVKQALRQGVPLHTLMLNRTQQLPGHGGGGGLGEAGYGRRVGGGGGGRGRRGRGRGGRMGGQGRMRGDGHDADGEESDVHGDREHDDDQEYDSYDSDHSSYGEDDHGPPLQRGAVLSVSRQASPTGAAENIQKGLRQKRSSSASVAPAPTPADVRPLKLNNLLP